MFPSLIFPALLHCPFLCLRRGVSKRVLKQVFCLCFSLPTQRCFQPFRHDLWSGFLFSAYAEVFPHDPLRGVVGKTFLCLRRGVSRRVKIQKKASGFSLPTQRCFRLSRIISSLLLLFSAYAEVFPEHSSMSSPGVTFLCLRRGVSFLSSISHPRDCFSLPTQRCFWRQGVIYGQWRLFSAYAEVFPHSPFGFLPSSSFLCLRRGVSA